MPQSIQSSPAIDIQGLEKVYKKRREKGVIAVDDLTLQIDSGQVFGLLGANGAGKTTTIKMLCGLIQPTKGTIKLNGYNVARERGAAMRQIGAVLEGTRNVYWRLSALENLLYFGRLKGVYGQELKDRAQLLLEELELADRRDEKIRTFSRGMQQKVAIACALIADPPIVLLDEPTLGLDVNAALTVKRWINNLARERRKTIILTTHQLDMAQALCDRVAIINKGQLITNRPTQELLGLFRKEFYEIRIKGDLNGHATELDHQLAIRSEDDDTVLSGAINSQDDLYRLLSKIHEMNLPLISVNPVEPDLEEVFINTINGQREEIVA